MQAVTKRSSSPAHGSLKFTVETWNTMWTEHWNSMCVRVRARKVLPAKLFN